MSASALPETPIDLRDRPDRQTQVGGEATPPLIPLRHSTRLLNIRPHRLHKVTRRQSLLIGDLVLRHETRQPPRHLAVIIRQEARSKAGEVSVGVALD